MNAESRTGSTELPAAERSDAADVAREDQADREADAALEDFERSAGEDLASILGTDLAEIEHEDEPSDLEPGDAMIPREAASASVSPGIAAVDGSGPEVELECPGCGLLVAGSDPRPTAEWFCPRCDYPLFFMTQPAIPEVDGERRTARHRLPGARGRTRTVAGACWNCGEWNESGVTACLRCAATLPKPLPPQLGPFETVEVPEPELVEVEVMYWPPIVISVVGGFISGGAFLWGVLLLTDRL